MVEMSCDEIIPSDVSGYCQCGAMKDQEGARIGTAVKCGHAPFTCADVCKSPCPYGAKCVAVKTSDEEGTSSRESACVLPFYQKDNNGRFTVQCQAYPQDWKPLVFPLDTPPKVYQRKVD